MSKKSIAVLSILLGIGIGIFIVMNPNIQTRLIQVIKQKPSSLQTIPSNKIMTQLVKHSIQTFALSLKERNMQRFYNYISPFWQKKTNTKELNNIFAPFIQSGIDLTVLQNSTPVMDKPPIISPEGNLYVVGHYNTKPSILSFKQTYRKEANGEWKLVEFFIELKKKKI